VLLILRVNKRTTLCTSNEGPLLERAQPDCRVGGYARAHADVVVRKQTVFTQLRGMFIMLYACTTTNLFLHAFHNLLSY